MRKSKDKANHERWLVSYADFITLLFAFFVVLFAASRADSRKQGKVADAMKTAFTEMGVFDAHAKSMPMASAGGINAAGTPTPIALPEPTEQTPEELKETIDRVLTGQVRQGRLNAGTVATRITPDGLVISLHDAGFFPSGSAEVKANSMQTLTTIINALPNRDLRIEGHTDNVPIHTELFATNWELSTARASAIARLIIDRGRFDPAKLAAAGYAEFHPIASNETEDGRTQNRRVDIILLSHQAPSQ